MKNILVSVMALTGLAVAQQMNIAAINSAPLPSVTQAPFGASAQSTIVFNTAAAATSISEGVEPTQAASSNNKRDSCAPQPAGSGPQAQPDTDTGFENYPYWHALAQSTVPPYPYIERFRDLNGSTSQNSYLTYYVLKSYDVNQCAQYCNSVNLCTAFNIFVERDPTVDPGAACPNPPSTSNYKCALWGSSISAATATNTGQYRNSFHVVIAGSNGYDKTALPIPVAGFSATANITGQAITLAGGVFLGSEFFAGPFDPELCGFYASAQTSVNRLAAQSKGLHTYSPANAFNAYYVYRAGIAWGTYCSLFTSRVDASSAGAADTVSGGLTFSVGSSFVYSADPQDAGTC